MKIFNMCFLAILVFSNTAFSVGEDLGKCSIKAEVPCSGPLHPNDRSYTYRLGTQLDKEEVLKSQLSIYQDLRERLRSEPNFPIFVELRSEKSYSEYIKTHWKQFLKKPEAKSLDYLQKENEDSLPIVELMPEPLRSMVLKEVPLSRFRIPDEAYSEYVLHKLEYSFPEALRSDSVLSEEQKNLLVQYGALAVLAAQGIARNVKVKK